VYDMPGAPAGGGGCGNSIEDDDSNEHVHTAVHGFPLRPRLPDRIQFGHSFGSLAPVLNRERDPKTPGR